MVITKTFIRQHYLITLPKEVRENTSIEVGDPIEILVSDNGQILLKPLKTIDASQSWFWTKEHQQVEKEAEKELKTGKMKSSKNVKHLIYELNK
ncbi:MAG: AbrB/MazE/SpoVT family DNA-binding domain-containing protein [Candidatus Firestonebacteria bacterium]